MASNNSSSTATAGGAAGAAKKGKMKGKTVDLTEFLNKPINWAEEMEELSLTPADPEHSGGYAGDEVRTEIMQKRSQLPTAPKAALSTSVDINRVPNNAPFSAYIGNISYDATEDDVMRFFEQTGLKVLNCRLMREGSRVKGYGYVEFGSREDLIEALGMNKQRLLNREVKIDLADRPEEHSQRQQTGGYGSGRGGRQQRSSGYDSEKSRDREQETTGDWRMNARANVGPPSPYEDDRRSQPRSMGPSGRPGQHPGQGQGYGYPPPQQSYAPPPYGPPQGYARRPDEFGPQYPSRPSGYDSDYAGGQGYGGYEQYPMMRQASYSSQYSGYASDREGAGGGGYRRGQPGSAGFYGSMRRDRRPPGGQHMGGDRYHGTEGYGAQPYPDYSQQAYYQGGVGYGGGGPRDSFRQQKPRGGGYDNRRGPQRDPYGNYDQSNAAGGRRGDERLSSVDTADGNDPSASRPKERPRLALQPRSVQPSSTPHTENTAVPDLQDAQQEPPGSAIRARTSVSSAEVFGGARPVDTAAREREIEEKLRKEREEFRRLEEEQRKQQQQQHSRENLRKSSSSNFVSERSGASNRRRTSDSQSSATSNLKGPSEIQNEEQSDGQVKILQRAHTIASENAGVSSPEHVEDQGHQEEYRRQPQTNRNQSVQPAPPPTQNYWSNQNRRHGPRNEQDEMTAASEPASTKSAGAPDEIPEDSEREIEMPSNISERQRGGSQSKSSETDRQHEEHEEDAVFKSQPRHPQHPQQYGSQRGRGRGRGGGHHQYHYHQDQSNLPPRFAKERDQQQYGRRGSSQTDDGQEQGQEKRRPSKEIVIRRGGQGTLSPATGARRGGPAGGTGRPAQHRPGSREREYQQHRGNGRRHPQHQQEQRRGSADSGLVSSQQQDENQAQKPPSGPRRQQQQQPNASGSRKSSATPAPTAADPPAPSFESKNKFEMLNMDED